MICSLIIAGTLLNGCDVCKYDNSSKIIEGDIYFSAVPVNATQPNIYRISADGKDLTQIVQNGLLFSPPSSNKKIVYLQEGLNGQRAVVMANIDGSNPIQIGSNNWQNPYYPIISPDGSAVAIVVGQSDLWVIVNNEQYLKVTNRLCPNTLPVFSPDGQKIAYYEGYDLTSNLTVRIMDITQNPPVMLNQNSFTEGLSSWKGLATLDWSGNGNLTYVISSTPIFDSVYVIPWNTSGSTNGFEISGIGAYEPVLSPDGQRVAFAGRDGNIWIRPLGSDPQKKINVTNNPSQQIYNLYPQWSPDGKHIIYSKYFVDDPNIIHATLEIADVETDQPQITVLGNNAYRGFWNRK